MALVTPSTFQGNSGIKNQQFWEFSIFLSGTAPFTYSILSGALPPGLTFDQPVGVITSPLKIIGIPTTPGSAYDIELKFEDALLNVGIGNYHILVDEWIPNILPDAILNEPYSEIITYNTTMNIDAFGGIVPGLPSGIVVGPPIQTGPNVYEVLVSGTPTETGTFIWNQLYSQVQMPEPDPQDAINSAPITTLTIIEIKKKNIGIGVPLTICCDPKSFADKVCPPIVAHRGYYYQKLPNSNCYVLKRR